MMSRLTSLWLDYGRSFAPKRFSARTRDGWNIALYRYPTGKHSHRTPVLLCHGMGANHHNMDGPGKLSMARYLARRGYDAWAMELRGAGNSTRPNWWNGKRYDWTFEDYVHHDARAALRCVLRETGAERVHWVGHSMGGMIAYALLMTPIQTKLASVVTLGSPTMSPVGHPLLDIGIPFAGLLRYLPPRLPSGTFTRLASPFASVILRFGQGTLSELGFHEGNVDRRLLQTLMLTTVEDIPASLLREFARWYETKTMSDRYAVFDFTEHLERIVNPLFIIAGNKDELTPARDLRYIYEQVSSSDKAFRVIGREHGFRSDYSHADLVLGLNAAADVYPLVYKWLEGHRAERALQPSEGPHLRVIPKSTTDRGAQPM
mgnify:FL=1